MAQLNPVVADELMRTKTQVAMKLNLPLTYAPRLRGENVADLEKDVLRLMITINKENEGDDENPPLCPIRPSQLNDSTWVRENQDTIKAAHAAGLLAWREGWQK